MILKTITKPTSYPVALSDFEGQTRLYDQLAAESSTVNLMIGAATSQAETIMRRALIVQVLELTLNGFPDSKIIIPKPPLIEINNVMYVDADGNTQELDPTLYKVVSDAEPAYIIPTYGASWPVTLPDTETVKIRYRCGYGPLDTQEGTPNNVPEPIKQWILMKTANLFENRETLGVAYRETKYDVSELMDGLIESYRIHRI